MSSERGLRTLAALVAAGGLVAAADRAPAPALVGRWQYLQPPDSEGEVLDLTLSGGRLRGVMNGLERSGEHGLFYYVVEVAELTAAADGSVRFVVGERTFHRERPALSALGGPGDAGSARERMEFEGRLEGEALVLRCRSADGSCPDATLRFERLPPAPGTEAVERAAPDGARRRAVERGDRS